MSDMISAIKYCQLLNFFSYFGFDVAFCGIDCFTRVYSLSTLHHHTWSNLPGFPPTYMHTTNNQILDVETAWEWD